MTCDVGTITNFVPSFHATWSSVLNIIFGLIYLYFKISSGIFAGFVLITIIICINFNIAKKIGSVFSNIMNLRD